MGSIQIWVLDWVGFCRTVSLLMPANLHCLGLCLLTSLQGRNYTSKWHQISMALAQKCSVSAPATLFTICVLQTAGELYEGLDSAPYILAKIIMTALSFLLSAWWLLSTLRYGLQTHWPRIIQDPDRLLIPVPSLAPELLLPFPFHMSVHRCGQMSPHKRLCPWILHKSLLDSHCRSFLAMTILISFFTLYALMQFYSWSGFQNFRSIVSTAFADFIAEALVSFIMY